MEDKKRLSQNLSPAELNLVQRLRQQPKMMERVERILEIANSAEGPLKTADEIEDLLLEEMRRLGNDTMTEWATGAEKRVGEELKQKDPTVLKRKKEVLRWWCIFGAVVLPDQVWSSVTQPYLRPLLDRLGVSARGKSRRLQRVLTDFGCEHSFARAVKSLKEHYGFELGSSAVRKVTLIHARRTKETLEREYAEPFRLLPAEGPAHVIAEIDGTMICTVAPGSRKGKRPREWKEMRLVAAQAQDSRTTVYGATFGSVAEAGRRWGHCARRAGRALTTDIHAVADGAEWIWLQCDEIFGAKGKFLCDFYHVSEYLAAAAPTCQSHQPDRWRRTQQKRLRKSEAPQVIGASAKHLEPDQVPDEEAPVRAAHRYLTNRLDCLDYDRALELGLPIGSGLIESGHRHVLHAGLKKAGTAWLHQHADQIGHLRVLSANNEWDILWN